MTEEAPTQWADLLPPQLQKETLDCVSPSIEGSCIFWLPVQPFSSEWCRGLLRQTAATGLDAAVLNVCARGARIPATKIGLPAKREKALHEGHLSPLPANACLNEYDWEMTRHGLSVIAERLIGTRQAMGMCSVQSQKKGSHSKDSRASSDFTSVHLCD